MFSTSVCLYIGLCVRTSHAPNNYFMYMVAIQLLSLWEKAALSGWMCGGVAHSKRLSEPKKLHRDCPDAKHSVVLPSVFVIRSTLTCCFSGNVPLLHTSAQRPGTSLHMISIARPSPRVSTVSD